jgi:hypothetical protein
MIKNNHDYLKLTYNHKEEYAIQYCAVSSLFIATIIISATIRSLFYPKTSFWTMVKTV